MAQRTTAQRTTGLDTGRSSLAARPGRRGAATVARTRCLDRRRGSVNHGDRAGPHERSRGCACGRRRASLTSNGNARLIWPRGCPIRTSEPNPRSDDRWNSPSITGHSGERDHGAHHPDMARRWPRSEPVGQDDRRTRLPDSETAADHRRRGWIEPLQAHRTGCVRNLCEIAVEPIEREPGITFKRL